MRTGPWRDDRGGALVAAIVVLALLLATTGATLAMTRSHLWAAGRARAAWQARASAEAGARHAAATLAPGTSFQPVVAGTGGLARPGAAGPLPGADGWTWFPGPPWGYGVTPSLLAGGSVAGELLVLDVEATGPRGTRRHLRATVGRARNPWVPAVLVVASGEASLAADATLVVDATADAARGTAALAADSRESAASLLAQVRSAKSTLRGATESAVCDPVDVAAWAAASGVPPAGPASVAVDLAGSSVPLARVVAGGSMPSLEGRGVVASTGDLRILGRVAFAGALLVAGELRLDSTDCAIAGIATARSLRAAGCSLRADPAAIAAADATARLPREAVLQGLSEE
ncbi:hypothetical protein KGQ64_10205 [bacterium]|nr:hypothetical protein [bacterium]